MANHNSKDEIVKFCLNSLKEEVYGKDKDDTDFIKTHVGDYRNILFPDFDQYVEARKRRASSSYKEVKENISKFMLGGVPKTREFLCEDLLRKDSDAWKSFMKASAAYWNNDLSKKNLQIEQLKIIVHEFIAQKSISKQMQAFLKNVYIRLYDDDPTEGLTWLVIGAALGDKISLLKSYYTVPYLSLKNISDLLFGDGQNKGIFDDYKESNPDYAVDLSRETMLHPTQTDFIDLFLNVDEIKNRNCSRDANMSLYSGKKSRADKIRSKFAKLCAANPSLISNIINSNETLLKKYSFSDNALKERLKEYMGDIPSAEEAIALVPDEYSTIRSDDLALLLDYIDGLLDSGNYGAVLSWLILGAYLRGHIHELNYDFTNHNTVTEIPSTDATVTLPKVKPISMDTVGAQRNTYVPREKLLEVLHSKITSLPESEKKILFINGMGGVGKSELARAYAYEYADRYAQIIYLSCRDNDSSDLEALLKQFDRSLSIDSLKACKSTTLLIVDNFNNDNDVSFYRQLLEQTGQATLLCTTRITRSNTYGNTKFFTIDPKEDNSEDFLFAQKVFEANYLLDSNRKMTPEDEQYSKLIIKKAGLNTIAIVIIASCLRESGIPVVDFYKQISGDKHVLTQIPDAQEIALQKYYEQNEGTVVELLMGLFDQFMSTNEKLTVVREIFTILEVQPGISLDIQFVENLLSGGNIPKATNIKAAIRNLAKYNWIQSDGTCISLHPLIADIILFSSKQKLLVEEEQTEFYSRILMNWLSLPGFVDKNIYFMNKVYSEYHQGDTLKIISLDLVCGSVFKISDYKEITRNYLKNDHAILIAYVESPAGNTFVSYDLDTQTEETLLVLNTISKEASEVHPEAHLLSFIYDSEAVIQLYIPDSLGKCPIQEIPDYYFAYITNKITALHLPDGLERIGNFAFLKCSNLSGDLNLPSKLFSIGNYAFSECKSLSGALMFPHTLNFLGEHAFSGCCNFSGNLSLSNSLIEISDFAFSECTGLSGHLELPDNIRKIGRYAFWKCRGFKGDLYLPEMLCYVGTGAFWDCSGFDGTLYLPDSLKYIESKAFSDCSKLTGSLKLPANTVSIGTGAFSGCISLDGSLEFSDNIQFIGAAAFSADSRLCGNLMLPKHLTKIENYTFSGCCNLSGELSLPENLQSIGIAAFHACAGLTGTVSIPESVKSIGDYAFSSCPNLSIGSVSKSVELGAHVTKNVQVPYQWTKAGYEIPESGEEIPDFAFSEATFLNGNLNILNDVIYIGNSAFHGCVNLTGSLHIPEQVKRIGNFAFAGCSGFDGELSISDQVTDIGAGAFSGCSDFSGELHISENLSIIKKYVFYGCSNLTGKLNIPSNVTEIEAGAFWNCNNFTGELVIPSCVTHIGASAFEGCSGFSGSIVLPDSIVSVEDYAFSHCTGLNGTLFIPTSLSCLGTNAFQECLFEKYIIYNPYIDIDIPYFSGYNPVICVLPDSVMEKKALESGLHIEYLDI